MAETFTYITATGSSAAELDKAVNERLAKGWELYGQPYTATQGENFDFCQAMTMKPPRGAMGRMVPVKGL